YYDRVVTYDNLDELGSDELAVVDFAGNDETLGKIAELVGDQLKSTIIVGFTHRLDPESGMTELADGREFFFLPAWIVKRKEDWGPMEFFKRSDQAWEAFAPTANEWLTIEEHVGTEAIKAAYESVLSGESRPDVGHILAFG
ncbi:MAG: DUF2855 family protein, partial [Solirubrobacterales bacterium]